MYTSFLLSFFSKFSFKSNFFIFIDFVNIHVHFTNARKNLFLFIFLLEIPFVKEFPLPVFSGMRRTWLWVTAPLLLGRATPSPYPTQSPTYPGGGTIYSMGVLLCGLLWARKQSLGHLEVRTVEITSLRKQYYLRLFCNAKHCLLHYLYLKMKYCLPHCFLNETLFLTVANWNTV